MDHQVETTCFGQFPIREDAARYAEFLRDRGFTVVGHVQRQPGEWTVAVERPVAYDPEVDEA